MGPRNPKSTVLTSVEEAMIVEFRRRTLLPLDDVLGCLKGSCPWGWCRWTVAETTARALLR
jgi:hypothetical protein